MVLMTATMFSSCNKNEFDSVSSDKVVTITIAPPSADATKVTTTETTKLTVTGWELGDKVDLYKLGTADNDYTKVEFSCTEAGSGKFSGTLPSGVNLEDLTLAIYNATIGEYYYNADPSQSYLRLIPKIQASTNVKDVIVMTAINNGSGFKMKVVNNIVKITNTTSSDIEAAWKWENSGFYDYLTMMAVKQNLNGNLGYQISSEAAGEITFEAVKFTLKANSDNYLFMFPGATSDSHKIGLSRKTDYPNVASLINFKVVSAISTTGGKYYSAPAILPADIVDLSATATANTYMVHSAGRYAFRATVKGNGGLDPLTGKTATTINAASIAGVKVLWELYGQGRAIKHNGTKYELSYSDGYVFFSTPDTFVEGDICLAIYDSSNNILWSWLIWATNDPGTMIHNTKTFMNRNLGAIDVGNCMRGFLYQWGRKDAYSAANGGFDVYPYYPSALIAFNYVSGDKTMAYTVTNPTSWVRVSGSNNSWMVQSEYSKKPWRADIKTIYDPCPIGWRVPTKENLSEFPGFPNTGIYNGYDDGSWPYGFGNPSKGYCWSASSDEGDDNLAYAFVNDGRNINHWSQGEGYAIRPVKE